jgi:hypothetical protein
LAFVRPTDFGSFCGCDSYADWGFFVGFDFGFFDDCDCGDGSGGHLYP